MCAKLKAAFLKANRKYAIAYDTVCQSNNENLDSALNSHSQEEADTLTILHSLDVTKRDPFLQHYIVCSDIGVFLLLFHNYPLLCARTVFPTGRGDNKRDIDIGQAFEMLGPEKFYLHFTPSRVVTKQVNSMGIQKHLVGIHSCHRLNNSCKRLQTSEKLKVFQMMM